MLISFAWTTPALLAGRKTVTRRANWTPGYFKRWQDAWDKSVQHQDLKYRVHDAYDKLPRNGGRKVGTIVLTCRPYLEPLSRMPESDLEAEGGLWPTLADFIGDADPEQPIPVIRFTFRPLEIPDTGTHKKLDIGIPISNDRQPGLFEGPPAGPVAKPAPRIEPPERPPPAPQLSFGGVYADWHEHYGDIRAVDIRARLELADDPEACDGWWVQTDDQEFAHILPVAAACGSHLREAKREVRARVDAWADA